MLERDMKVWTDLWAGGYAGEQGLIQKSRIERTQPHPADLIQAFDILKKSQKTATRFLISPVGTNMDACQDNLSESLSAEFFDLSKDFCFREADASPSHTGYDTEATLRVASVLYLDQCTRTVGTIVSLSSGF
jgi:hypothetical protein